MALGEAFPGGSKVKAFLPDKILSGEWIGGLEYGRFSLPMIPVSPELPAMPGPAGCLIHIVPLVNDGSLFFSCSSNLQSRLQNRGRGSYPCFELDLQLWYNTFKVNGRRGHSFCPILKVQK